MAQKRKQQASHGDCSRSKKAEATSRFSSRSKRAADSTRNTEKSEIAGPQAKSMTILSTAAGSSPNSHAYFYPEPTTIEEFYSYDYVNSLATHHGHVRGDNESASGSNQENIGLYTGKPLVDSQGMIVRIFTYNDIRTMVALGNYGYVDPQLLDSNDPRDDDQSRP